jgi:two-component system, sensor histidine kinase YesM
MGAMTKQHLFSFLFRRTFVINLFFILAVTFSVCALLGSYMIGESDRHSRETVRLIARQLDTLFRTVDDIERVIVTDHYLRIALSIRQALPDYNDPFISDTFATAKDKMVSMMLLLDGFNFCMLDNTGHLQQSIYSTNEVLNGNFRTRDAFWYRRVMLGAGKFHIVYNNDCDFYLYSEKAISFIRTTLDLKTDKPNAFLVVNLPYSRLVSILQERIDPGIPIEVLDPQRTVIYSTVAGPARGKPLYEESSSYTGLVIRIYGRPNPIVARIGNIILLVVGIMCIYVAVIFIVSLLAIKRFTLPIYSLISKMSSLGRGDFDVKVSYEGPILELHELISSYNTLIEKIQSLIKTNYEQKVLMAQAELKALQEEINPHFLFNTLETISSQAIVDGSQAASLMCQKLGALFSYLLEDSDIVTLGRELRQLRDYVYIEEKCVYFQGVKVEYAVDPDLVSQSIPKLTLQPIVENCLKHAFRDPPAREPLIRIEAVRLENTIRIDISDNGSGISPEEVEGINRDLRDATRLGEKTSHRKSGLLNVNARLCFYFGEDYSMKVSSTEGDGTSVTFSMPSIDAVRRGNDV